MNLEDCFKTKLENATDHLRRNGVKFEVGLSQQELVAAEDRYGIVFPPDLRWYLSKRLPVGEGFPNWRNPDDALTTQLAWPFEGLCEDIRRKMFWWQDWGTRPDLNEAAVSLAMKHSSEVPVLIPIFGHSYLPSHPSEPENPVFSVHQADIIHRGANLAEYLLWIHHDDDVDEDDYPAFCESYKAIPFWSELTRQNFEWEEKGDGGLGAGPHAQQQSTSSNERNSKCF